MQIVLYFGSQVASRKVTQGTAILVIIVGLFGKVTAFLASIPDPVVGGILASLIGNVDDEVFFKAAFIAVLTAFQ